jgi:hypothetical protein
MMKELLGKIILIAAVSILASAGTSAQYDCNDYEKFNCAPSPDKHFKRNGQSRSAMIQIGYPTEMNIIVYKGQDYRISFCSDKYVLGEQIIFRIVEVTRERVEEAVATADTVSLTSDEGDYAGSVIETRITDSPGDKPLFKEVRKVLYDNTEFDLAQEMEFSSTATKRITLEIMATGSDHPKRMNNPESPDIGCLGVLIEHMPTPGIGF